MQAILGRIVLGTFELAGVTAGAQNLQGSFSCHGASSVNFLGNGGTDFSATYAAVPGMMRLGGIMLARSTSDATINNKHFKIGDYVCAGHTDVLFTIASGIHGSFSSAGKTSVSFFGVLGTGFRSAGKTSVSFTSKGRVTGHFSSSGATSVSFTSTSVVPPRFSIAGKTDVIFYVRSGQIPTCFYDNGYIDPDNRIQNYVF